MGNEDRRLKIAAHQRRYFNALAGVFDVPQPEDVMDRLRQIVASAALYPGDVVLDAGTGAGVLVPLIESYRPSLVLACDLAEQMLARARNNNPRVHTFQCDVMRLPLRVGVVDVVFMNAMYGNIADKPAACADSAAVLRPGGRLVISHPEGKAFVDRLRETTDLFIEPFPSKIEFQSLVEPVGLEVIQFRDEPRLYLMVAQKIRSIDPEPAAPVEKQNDADCAGSGGHFALLRNQFLAGLKPTGIRLQRPDGRASRPIPSTLEWVHAKNHFQRKEDQP